MPRRPALHRVATALLALLYFVAWGEPVTLHPCPMHDGVGAAVAGAHGPAAGRTHAAAARDAHGAARGDTHDAAHAAAHAHVAPAEPAPADGHDVHLCQCLGHGCCAAAVMVPTAQQVRWFVAVTRRADPPAAAPSDRPRAPEPRLFPPATGPPALG